jgi:hypothetical protein
MGRFIIKILCLVLVFTGSYYYLVDKLSHRYVDPYYPKFTQEAGSLILGISRAGEDINPSVLEKTLDTIGINMPIINFAMFKYQSPYGDIYLEGIKKKLINQDKAGLFILSVTPGNFSAPKNMSVEDILEMDKKMTMGKIKNYTAYPNYDYIINCYEQPLYNSLFPQPFENQIAHSNGWNEIVLETPSFSITKANMKYYKSFNEREYSRIAKKEEIADYRLESFKKIIHYLKSRGRVFIVFLPAHEDILAIENKFWPDLQGTIVQIAKNTGVGYLDYSSSNADYLYYDGSHMESESANRFSRILSEDIKYLLDSKTYSD